MWKTKGFRFERSSTFLVAFPHLHEFAGGYLAHLVAGVVQRLPLLHRKKLGASYEGPKKSPRSVVLLDSMVWAVPNGPEKARSSGLAE